MLKVKIIVNPEYTKDKIDNNTKFSDYKIPDMLIYKDEILKSIRNNRNHIHKVLEELGFTDNYKFSLRLFPREFCLGEYIGNGVAEWGYPDIFPEYQTIGIFHEFLHYLFEQVHYDSTDDERWRLHALIVLIADVYLRSKINSNGILLLPKIENGYHERLVSDTEIMLPAFEIALQSNQINASYLLRLFKLPELNSTE